jgi:hypothetical protein
MKRTAPPEGITPEPSTHHTDRSPTQHERDEGARGAAKQGSPPEVPDEVYLRVTPGLLASVWASSPDVDRWVRGSVFDDHVGTLLHVLEQFSDGSCDRDYVKDVLEDDDYVEIRKRWKAL